jgi:ABC-2 type transport system ATP-binding protein
LLGPNGAGKTTTIEMIEGITEPTSGEILYKGQARTKAFAQEAGIQFQQTALMDYLTVKETLALFASFYQHSLSLEAIVELCDLAPLLTQNSTALSGGQRQRLLLALALINNPDIVFLDEPTTGLDPQARRHFWALIERIKAQGKTIILTTHYMDEAQLLCDELLIIDKGKIIAQGSPEALLAEHFQHNRVSLDSSAFSLDRSQLSEEVIEANGKITLLTQSVENTIAFLIAHHIDITSISIGKPNLEDLFIKLTGHQLRQ